MPMSYDKKTGVPSFNPFENELTEGETPEAKLPELKGLIHKLDPFKGDPPPGVDKLEMKYVDVPAKRGNKGEDTIKINRPTFADYPDLPITTIEHMANEMLRDVIKRAAPKGPWLQAEIAKEAKPAQLDNTFTTDEELQDLARQVEDRTIKNWPMLRRLLNRLRRAEGK